MTINLDELKIYTAAEASQILGKDSGYIRQIFVKYPNRFPKGSIRKMGRDIIVTREAIDALSSYLPLIEQIRQLVTSGKLNEPFTVQDIKQFEFRKSDGSDYAENSIDSILSNSSRDDSTNKNKKVLNQILIDGIKYYEFI